MSLSKKDINMVKSMLGQLKVQNKPKQQKKKGKKNPPSNALGSGSYRVTRRVLFLTVTNSRTANNTVQNYGVKVVSGDTVPTITSFLKIFQEFRFIGNVTFEYIPTCSSQTGGGLILGYALDKVSAENRSKVASLSPVAEVPVWQRGSLTVAPKSYQRAAAQFFKSSDTCFYLAWNNSSTTLDTFGEVWLRFTAEFISPIA